MSKDTPLHKRTHFRRIREIITELSNYEGFNINSYDLFHIKAYETVGQNLKGKNVKYNIDNGYSCWVGDNRYEVFEVPAKSNRENSPYGEFIYLAYNKSFQYYLFGKMQVELDVSTSKSNRFVNEDVYFRNYGKYSIVFGTRANDNSINKDEYGSKFDPGSHSSEHNFDFDTYNSRKIAYKTNKYKILESIGVRGLDSGKIVGSDVVKVYNKDKKPFNSNKPKTGSSSNKPGNKPGYKPNKYLN